MHEAIFQVYIKTHSANNLQVKVCLPIFKVSLFIMMLIYDAWGIADTVRKE